VKAVALKQSSEALRRPLRALSIIFPVVALGSLVLGYVGLHQFVAPAADYQPLDLIYHDLQLFFLGSDPLQEPNDIPMALNIARFSAPAVTAYALIEATRRLLAVELSRLQARRTTGHAIVCGETAFADALTRRLRAQGTRVVEIRPDVDEFVTAGEPLRIVGDARDPEVLQDAGINRAAMVYACAAASSTNIAIALAVNRTATENGDRLIVHALVTDHDLCVAVQAFFMARPAAGRVRLDFINIDHIAARRLFADDELAPLDGRAPRIFIAGTDGFACALVVEAARSWRTAGTHENRPLPVTMIGFDAALTLNAQVRRYPFIAQVCELHAFDGDLLVMMRQGELSEPPDRVLITDQDEEHALMTSMAAERYWRGQSGPITVRLDGAMIGGPSTSGRMDVAGGSLRLFGAVTAASDPELIRDDLTERLARVLHDRYLIGRLTRNDSIGSSDRAMVSWDRLPGELRHANRTQAEDIGRKLTEIGYLITPRYTEQEEGILADSEIDVLARMEHQRWCHEQQRAGWRYAPQLDEQQKLHPALLDWDDLPEAMQARNYHPIRELPSILGEAGFQIVRA
jgi:hypothetical protein